MYPYQLSWVPDTKNLEYPIYRSLYQYIARDIRIGRLVPNQQMPSQRELSYYLNINFTTVTRAYNLAVKEGLLYGKKGKGTFVASNANIDSTVFPEQLPPKAIDLSYVQAFGNQKSCNQTLLKNVLPKINFNQIFEYQTMQSEVRYQQAGQKWLDALNLPMTDQILVTNGAQGGLTTILNGLFRPGDGLAVDTYTYSNLIALAKLRQIKLIPITSDEQGIRSDLLKKALQNEKIKGIYLMPLRNNPTNVSISLQRRKEIAQIAEREGLLILEDDYLRFLNPQKFPSFLQLLSQQTIEIISTAKIFAPGIRIGYLAFANPYKKILNDAFVDLNSQVSTLDAEIMTNLTEQVDLSKLFSQRIHQLRKANKIYRSVFHQNVPVSFHQWLVLNEDTDLENLQNLLQSANLYVVSGNHFLTDPQVQIPHLRVSLSSTVNLNELEFGLKELRKILIQVHAI